MVLSEESALLSSSHFPLTVPIDGTLQLRSAFDGPPRCHLTENPVGFDCVQCADLAIKGLPLAGHSGVANKHAKIFHNVVLLCT